MIVTCNRNKDCKEVVNTVLMQRKPPHEIIIVDDASSVPFQLENIDAMGINIKVIINGMELGLAVSRNIGILSSTSDIIAFIDDDALAPVDWIEKIQRGFIGSADVIGGPCKPLYLSSPPKWWNEKLFGIFVGIGNSGIIGCNFAVKKEIFNKIGYFNEKLGRRQGKLISREETPRIGL